MNKNLIFWLISLAAMSPRGEVAALQVSSGWRQLASAPSAREEHAAAWNPQDVQMLVFGGVNSSGTFLNDLWIYRPAANAWTEVKPTGGPPTTRLRPSAVWDPVNSQLLVFGGASVNGTLNDQWAYRPSTGTWAQMAAGPSPRQAQTAVWDATNGQMLVFGGWSGSAALNDLWSYRPAANRWTRLDAAGPPLERGWHAAVWDPDNGQMLVFGGSNNVSLMNDLWAYRPSDNTWRQLSPAGNPPSVRDWATAVWDSGNAQVLVFGGAPFGPVPGTQVTANDLFSYRPSGNTWLQLSGAGPPPPRFAHTAVWDPSGGEMLIFGGLASLNGPSLGDLWSYRPTAATSAGEGHSSIPRTPCLSQNFPNPFNPTTTIRFSIPTRDYVSLKVFDLLGREVATLLREKLDAAEYSIVFNSRGLPSGIYFYRLQVTPERDGTSALTGSFVETKKLVLLK